MTVVLAADSIGKIYRGKRVLTAAALTARSGDVVGLLGRMGVGKSTLLKVCAGITPPDSGWVRFSGAQYARPRLSTLARDGMYFLAESGNLVPSLTGAEHFACLRERYNCAVPIDVIQSLNLRDLMDRPTHTLSGGELRRAEVGVAMFRGPTCLLADEVFRGIDPLSAELIGSSLQKLARTGCAVVITGHEIHTFLPYLDHVVWMTAGTTYSLGSPAEAWRDYRFSKEYLGHDPEA